MQCKLNDNIILSSSNANLPPFPTEYPAAHSEDIKCSYAGEFSIIFSAATLHISEHTSKCHDFDDFTGTHVVGADPELFMGKTKSGVTTTSRHMKHSCIINNYHTESTSTRHFDIIL